MVNKSGRSSQNYCGGGRDLFYKLKWLFFSYALSMLNVLLKDKNIRLTKDNIK
jgi:hypothetical protein